MRRHLDRSERFTLVFLVSADPPALDEVRRRLEAALQFRASRLEIVAIEGASAEWVAPLESALAPDEDRIRMRSPVWLTLDRPELPALAAPRSPAEPSRVPVRIAASEPEKLLPVAEWRRVAARASIEPELVSPFVAHVAVEAALENSSLSEAMQIAEQELTLARTRATDGVTDRQQDLAIALDDVGRVARELGRPEAAEQAFAESLALRRRLP